MYLLTRDSNQPAHPCWSYLVLPTKTQISLQSDQSSLSTRRSFEFLAIQNVPTEDSNQTVRKCKLIWFFLLGPHVEMYIFWHGDSNVYWISPNPDLCALWSDRFWVKKNKVIYRHHNYCIYPKYWDTWSTCHTSPKIWNSPIYHSLICLKYCCMYGSVDPDQMPQNVASDLGLHCLQMPLCSNT